MVLEPSVGSASAPLHVGLAGQLMIPDPPPNCVTDNVEIFTVVAVVKGVSKLSIFAVIPPKAALKLASSV